MKKSGGNLPGKSPPKRRRVGFQEGEPAFLLASDCIKLHLVSSSDDMVEKAASTSNDLSFSPEFIHEYFGKDGRIYGYRGLKIDVWIHAASFHVYAEIQFASKNQTVAPGRFTTDIQAKLQEMFKVGLVQSREEFINNFSVYASSFEEMRKKEGELVADFQEPDVPEDEGGNHCQIVRFKLLNAEAREWQERMSSLALLFIDGASAIDVTDPRWETYVCVQPLSEKEPKMASSRVIGSLTVYNFYNYPDSTRPRLSQILVLPPYQGKSYGFRLVETLNATSIERNCFDVTMEDPSDSLQELRDSMDVLRLISFDPAKAALEKAISRIQSHVVSSVSKGQDVGDRITVTSLGEDDVAEAKRILLPPLALVESARSKFKMSKSQLKRCWEILLYLCLNSTDEKVFKQLLASRLRSELLGRPRINKKGSRRKVVIDTFNEYGNENTFVMFRVQPEESKAIFKAHCGVDDDDNMEFQEPPGEEEGTPDPGQVAEAVEELLKAREEEIENVARKVCRWCKSRSDQGRIDASLFLKANLLLER